MLALKRSDLTLERHDHACFEYDDLNLIEVVFHEQHNTEGVDESAQHEYKRIVHGSDFTVLQAK